MWGNLAARTMTHARPDQFKAGVGEGDVAIAKGGAGHTNELVPTLTARLSTLLLAPKATIAEPDIDWSQLLCVNGNVVAKNLRLGGSVSEIEGHIAVKGVMMGYARGQHPHRL